MKRRFFAVLLISCAATPAVAEGPTLKEAQQRWLRGNYEEARAQYEALAKEPKQKSPAAIGLSRVRQSLGEYDKSLAVVEAALMDDAKNADLIARRAELLHLTGRWDEAER